MSGVSGELPRIWLRSFYGFSPEEDGYIGWTQAEHRDRMLGLVKDGDLFMIYGAAAGETRQHDRNMVLGFLQIEARPIRDQDKASSAGLQSKRNNGWADRWTHALPVVRAWRADESILLERIATQTYRPEAGRAIAAWNPQLTSEDVERALRVKVTEVPVFGEPPLPETALRRTVFEQEWKPSRAFPGGFGERTVDYQDGPTKLYLARFHGDGFALLGRPKRSFDRSVLIKIGVTNNPERRIGELNAGFPPKGIGRWEIVLLSADYEGRQQAETAEGSFKDKTAGKLESLGGEFFLGDWDSAQSIFFSVSGVARLKP